MARAQRFAAASGTTATPTSAATIRQIASKSRNRARKCRRMPSRAACREICPCNAVALVSPTKLQPAPSWNSIWRRPASGPFSRGDECEPVFAEGEALDIVRQRMLGGKTEIGRAVRYGGRDIRALTLLDIDVDIGMLAQERSQRARQMLRQPRGVGKQKHAGAHAGRIAREIAAHGFHVVDDEPGVIEQGFAGRGQLDAAAAALEQRHAKGLLEPLDPRARGGERQMSRGRLRP